mgnify:FL=1
MKKTATKKRAKKPRVFRSVDEVKKAYFPKKYAEDMKALNDKIDLMDSRLRTLKAWETMQDAMEESRLAPAEEWVPKVNEVMGCVNNQFAYICDSVNEDGWSINVSNSGGSLGQKSYKIFRKATGDEHAYRTCVDIVAERVASHKAKEEQRAKEAGWLKFDVLQEGDQCECTRAQLDELLVIAKEAGLVSTGVVFIPLQVPADDLVRNAVWEKGKLTYNDTPGNIPFAEFKRRLRGTIAKRAEDERAKEMAKKLEFGTRIEHQDDKGWRICIDKPCGSAGWLANKAGTDKLKWMKRHEFTVID